jgi:hypothetical protein
MLCTRFRNPIFEAITQQSSLRGGADRLPTCHSVPIAGAAQPPADVRPIRCVPLSDSPVPTAYTCMHIVVRGVLWTLVVILPILLTDVKARMHPLWPAPVSKVETWHSISANSASVFHNMSMKDVQHSQSAAPESNQVTESENESSSSSESSRHSQRVQRTQKYASR